MNTPAWKIQHSNIASLQKVTTPEGREIAVIYMNDNHITVVKPNSEDDDEAYLGLPEGVRRKIENRFNAVFALPVEQRNKPVSLFREQPAYVDANQ